MNAEMKELMKRITQAIENNYFSKIRSATRLEVNEKPHT
jgi:hypothetical protein